MTVETGKKRATLVSIPQIYKFAPLALRQQPAIVLPFLVFAGIELICLFILYLSPRQPLSAVFGPPIRVFWGEAFLHYPNNFLLLPQLASLSRTLLYIVAGSVLNGIAVLMVSRAYSGVSDRALPVEQCLKRYGALFGISLFVTVTFMLLVRGMGMYFSFYFSRHASLLLVPAAVWNGPVTFVLNLLAGIAVQAFFIYAVPVAILENKGGVRALLKSWKYFSRMPMETLAMVTIPVLVYVPVMVLQYKTPFFVASFPESVFLIAAAGSLINSLIVDVLVTVSVTYLYLKAREQ